MTTLKRTNSNDPDFQKLIAVFDEYLIDIDGEERDFFAFHNNKYLDYALVCYENNEAVGCGGFKEYDTNTAEIKRMFVHPDHRKKGIASIILNALESWSAELNYTNYILETSPKLINAIALYKKSGYSITENYGQYIGIENSVCMKKII